MKRTFSATLRYLRGDLSIALLGLALIGVLSLVLGGLLAGLDPASDAAMIATVIFVAGGVLVSLILSIVYFSHWYPVLLVFPANRRGLLAGFLAYCLGISALMQLAALVVGSLFAAVSGAVTGQGAGMPWQWTPWYVWPLALVLPVLAGVVLGGLQCRFGPKAFWAVYFVFIVLCSTSSQWLGALADWIGTSALLALGAASGVALLALAALSVRWLLRAAVR